MAVARMEHHVLTVTVTVTKTVIVPALLSVVKTTVLGVVIKIVVCRQTVVSGVIISLLLYRPLKLLKGSMLYLHQHQPDMPSK